MTLNSSPTKHCILHSIKKVGSDNAEAAVETGAAAANRAKCSEWEGGREREERGRVSYELMLLLRKIIIIMMMRQRWGFCPYELMNLKNSLSFLNLKTKLDSNSFCNVDVLLEP